MIPDTLVKVLDENSRENLESLGNQHVIEQLQSFVALCKPLSIMVLGETQLEVERIRELALETGEEKLLKLKGHTIHFDGYYDLARPRQKAHRQDELHILPVFAPNFK